MIWTQGEPGEVLERKIYNPHGLMKWTNHLRHRKSSKLKVIEAERVNRSITYACPPFALPQVFLWPLLATRQIQAREALQHQNHSYALFGDKYPQRSFKSPLIFIKPLGSITSE